MLEITDLHAQLSDGSKTILNGVTLTIAPGEIHALMGPNGSGKSTLTHVVMGNPRYKITQGTITLDGTRIDAMETYQRARTGIFSTFQYPVELSGVTLQALISSVDADVSKLIEQEAKKLNVTDTFLARAVNDEFSGGEKKRMETLQLALSSAKYAILDEIDSGLDVDALRDIAKRVMELVNERQLGVIAITHYDRLLEYLKPTHVHIFADGKIVNSGGIELANQLEEQGYESFITA